VNQIKDLTLMKESDGETLRSLPCKEGQNPSPAETSQCQRDVSAESKSRLAELSRHPLVVTLVGFLCTGLLGGYLTWWLNYRDHQHDMETSIRNSAIAAVSDISELVNERRTRGNLVVSSIRRGAPETEAVARKTAYDEAYIRWNSKVPGDLLRIRAGLHLSRSRYEKYIDSLTNANILLHGLDVDAHMLMHGPRLGANPGLFSIMDACLTRAFDAYRVNSFTPSDQISAILSSCKFSEVYMRSIECFAIIAEAMYLAVNEIGVPSVPVSDQPVIEACKPPDSGG
jgi:hypothetical protein